MLRPPHDFRPIEQTSAHERFRQRLRAIQEASPLFPHSDGPTNPLLNRPDAQRQYERTLRGYRSDEADRRWSRYAVPDNADIGHKLHLNALPRDVHLIAATLQELGLPHKYLSGGDARQGKIFTLYPGAYGHAQRMAGFLSERLDGLLCRPACFSEAEYAPNVSGRFTERGLRFHKDGEQVLRGLPLLFTDLETLEDPSGFVPSATWKTAAFERSFRILADTYGPYFYGP